MTSARVRYGMVGGGPGAFIGAVHRAAAALDGEIDLVAGAFSSDADRSREQGAALGLDPSRVYASWEEMIEQESRLPEERRIQFATIVTPNHLHHVQAAALLEAGFHVVCDKPLTTTLEDAEELCRIVAERDAVFALTHNYTGYPMVKQARGMIANGALGEIRKIVVEYSQGWLATDLESTGHRQAAWRTDPARAGVAGALGDIGTHAENLVGYVTGLHPESLIADLTTFVDGRRLDDDANLLIRYVGGARGVLIASQVALGEDNGLSLRVYGTDASLVWRHEAPETLWLLSDGPAVALRRGHEYLHPAAIPASRLPPGHPEGFIEAFANVYRNAGRTVAAVAAGRAPEPLDLDFPTVYDGARGVHFLGRAVESAELGDWVDARYTPPGV